MKIHTVVGVTVYCTAIARQYCKTSSCITRTKAAGDVHCLGKVGIMIACAVTGLFFLKTHYFLGPKSLSGRG